MKVKKHGLVKQAGNALKKATPTVLSCIGALGVVATAVLAVKATPKALERIEDAKEVKNFENGENLTRMETIAVCWTCYAPAAITGIATIGCIFGANVLNRRQQASLASAYALVSRQYGDYKRKVKELYGQETHNRIVKELAAEKVDKDHVILSSGEFYSSDLDFEGATEETRLFYDRISNRYFESTIGKVLQAEYHLNRNLTLRGNVSLNEFYSFLGIDTIPEGDDIGWFIDDDEIYWIDFSHPYMPIDDGLNRKAIEAWIIDPVFDPRHPAENW